MGLYIKTDPIIWSGETDDGNAVAALAECGWDEERRRHELTLAISEEGRDFVRALLEDLIARAREEKEKQRSNASSKGGDL
jgi:hypothetical protein